jgi:hypothetical protein
MRAVLLAATALALLGGSAYAQTSNSGSNSTTTVNTSSGSQSSSVSSPRVNVIGNPIGNGASSSTSGAKSSSSSRSSSRSAAVGNVTNVYTGSGGTTDPTSGGSSTTGTAGTTTGTGADPMVNMNYSGSYTVRNTPEVIPPNVVGGNPCAVGASGGLSMPGFGLAMGATWADRACERRQQAALLFNMGEQKVAMELMCQDDNIRSAMKIAARPCTADVPPPAPVAQTAAPAVIAMAAPAAIKPVAIASAMPAAPKPEWCLRAKPDTEASRAYVAQVCGR